MEASSSHSPSPRHGDGRDPRNDPVADGARHARPVAVGPGVQVVLPLIGGICICLGLVLMVATIRLFVTVGKGTLAPWNPTQRLVVRGVYRHVRNPDDLRGVLRPAWGGGAGGVLAAASAGSLVFVVVNAVYIPLSEEPGLVKRFGDDYLTYKRNVPRWIPRLRPWNDGFRNQP